MRRTLSVLLLSILSWSGAAHAQSGHMTIICEDCRDPIEYPDDYVNFAFNQIYGEGGWLTLDMADDFFIVNLQGDRVYADVDFKMQEWRLFGLDLPFWPRNMLQITLALPNGLIYIATRSVFMTPLPVPSSPDPGEEDPDPTSDSGGEGVDEPEGEPGGEPEPEEPEFDPIYTTGIEDPDEDGEFPEPDWCEEC